MQIPKDKVSSGHYDYQCYAEFYGATKEEVEGKAKEYFARYPRAGYNTDYRPGHSPWQHADGYWCCIIDRWHSCE